MNAQYYYRLKFWGNCNDFGRCLLKNQIPPGKAEKYFANNRCDGILLKSHGPYLIHHESSYQLICRHVVGHDRPKVVGEDTKDNELNQAIDNVNAK